MCRWVFEILTGFHYFPGYRFSAEDQRLAYHSNPLTDGSVASSDSINASRSNKHHRHDGGHTPTRFKGVVLQQNGHWGAQIYANHQRIWLGTFKSEQAAAMAYDSAAIKLRSGDCHHNFPWSAVSEQEHVFQKLYTTEAVLNMIKDGSYDSKFAEHVRKRRAKVGENGSAGFDLAAGGSRGSNGQGRILCHELFQKELTPSDVGKLNRLVIPKKHAVKFFPRVSESEEGEELEDVQLVFYDKYLRSWKFRYCYWKSSQSYVFTRGWNRFVRDKELKAKDSVTFLKCEYREGVEGARSFLMIDVVYSTEASVNRPGNLDNMRVNNLVLGTSHASELDDNCKRDEEEEEEPVDGQPAAKKKCVRLFGVIIN